MIVQQALLLTESSSRPRALLPSFDVGLEEGRTYDAISTSWVNTFIFLPFHFSSLTFKQEEKK